jgi:hypothetical protein
VSWHDHTVAESVPGIYFKPSATDTPGKVGLPLMHTPIWLELEARIDAWINIYSTASEEVLGRTDDHVLPELPRTNEHSIVN